MKKRPFKYKKALGITVALALFLGGIGIVQKILDDHTQNFQEESVAKVDEKKTTTDDKQEKKTVEKLLNVSQEDIIKVAKQVRLDTIFFLTGKDFDENN